jgi:V/A-type H+-transporting ATPase subunit D
MTDILNVNPNRMELMKLARRLALARRGHRLLKDKQDELMDRFLEITASVRNIRKEIEKLYRELRMPYFTSRYLSDASAFRSYCEEPVIKADISGDKKRVMNLIIPRIRVAFKQDVNRVGNINISSVFPGFLEGFAELAKKIVDLANLEKEMYMIADELQKVRRRVNALEYIFIPKLDKTIRYISMQLEEMERENITRLMKIKEIVRK